MPAFFGSPELILLAAIALLLVGAASIPQNHPLPATVKPAP